MKCPVLLSTLGGKANRSKTLSSILSKDIISQGYTIEVDMVNKYGDSNCKVCCPLQLLLCDEAHML